MSVQRIFAFIKSVRRCVTPRPLTSVRLHLIEDDRDMVALLDGVLADLGLSGMADPQLPGDPRPAALAAPLAVAECAIASVAACLTAAADLTAARTGRRPDRPLASEPAGVSKGVPKVG
jgi:hypothetical protein